MQAVIELLLAKGFVRDGATVQQTVRVPTVANPVYGGIGGELTTMGGRQRFALPGTDIKATVGKRTTFFYRLTDKKVLGRRETESIAHLETRDLAAIETALAQLPTVEAQP